MLKNVISVGMVLLHLCWLPARAELQKDAVPYRTPVISERSDGNVVYAGGSEILMSSEPAVYVIGDEPVPFYDDGGKTGKITENFKGQVTFKPETAGKKILIDFTQVELFESSNKNEILCVYNGTEVSEQNLLMRIWSGKPQKVRSTAPGGELTVTLVADTGFPKQGFEAMVSQFTPQPMTLEGTEVQQYTEGTVCAGDTEQPILSWNLRTVNTEPALQVKSFSFTSVGTFENITGASVYYTERSNKFNKQKKIGSIVAVAEDKFTVAVSDGVSMSEGDNYFWLAYDLDARVENGRQIDASLESMELSDGTHAVTNGSPEGFRKVENVCYALLGTYEKTVFGSWIFKSQPNPLPYYSGYDPESGVRSVTFLPGTPGKVMELEFSEFSLYYSSSSYYGVRARFEVYSGRDTNGELLWTLNNTADKDKGPQRILRSSAPDGSLTVVFDSKAGSSSSYTSTGFTAEVREYLSQPMQVEAVNAFQANSGFVKPGARNSELIGFRLDAVGDRDQLSLEQVSLNLKGCASAVEQVILYGGTRDSVLVKEQPLATAAVTSDEMQLKLDVPRRLVEGQSYFWVAVDLKESAATDTQIDASLTSVTVSGKEIVPAVGDPDGACVVKNMYLLQAGENGEVNVGAQSLMFYDNGGPEGQTPKNFKGTVTFVPTVPGQVIRLVFHDWSIAGNDYMKISYGREAKQTADFKYKNTTKTLPIVSKAEDGSITVEFRCPSYGVASEGWAIEVQSYTMQDLFVGKVAAAPVANQKLMKGMTDVPFMRLDVEVEGDKGQLDVTALEAAFDGSAAGVLNGCRIFATDTVSTFAPLNLYAENEGQNGIFTGKYAIREAGVYKFWLAGNISADAAEQMEVAAEIKKVTVSDRDYNIENGAKFSGQISKGFSGTYTIGAEGDYTDFKSAMKALEGGIDGPVVFNILPGEYKDLLEIPEIPGTSAVNTLTLRSSTGDYRDVQICSDNYVEPGYSDDKMFHEYGVVTVAGADYVTIEGLTVTTTDLHFPSLLHIKNRSRHVTVKNCHLFAERTETYSMDINLIYQYAQNLPNCNNDYLTVENCLIEGGYNGIRVAGTSFVALPKQQGARIIGNVLRNQGAKSVYVTGEENLVIERNVIDNTESGKNDFNGIDATCYQGLSISGNSFNLATLQSSTAMYLRKVDATEQQQAYIVNNEIHIKNQSSSRAYGIKFRGSAANLHFAHNTLLMDGTSGYVLDFTNEMTQVEVCNNIFTNRSDGMVYSLSGNEALKGLSFNHNVLHTVGTVVAEADAQIATFDEWKQLSGEMDSYYEPVDFLSDVILEPAAKGNLVSGKKLDYVQVDLNGTQRADIPTVGAYEYQDTEHAPVFKEGYPIVTGISNQEASVLVKSSMNGKIYALIRESSAGVPTADEVLAGEQRSVRTIEEASFRFTGLKEQTVYVAYLILENLRGVRSEVLSTHSFSTSIRPTEVSTFEQVKAAGNGFEDGTAMFEGFTVVEDKDCVVVGQKVARIDGTGTVLITNAPEAIVLNGFYLKAAAEVEVQLFDTEKNTGSFKVPATDGKWVFVNLKDKGAVYSLKMIAAGEAFIDNFSGVPQEVLVYVSDCQANEGESVTLDATVSPDRGVAPYSYTWRDRAGEVISQEATYSFQASSYVEYSVEVTDAWNQTSSDVVAVRVEGNPRTATFEEMALESESYWTGELPEDPEVGKFSYPYSGSYLFSVMNHGNWWSGFAWSNQTSSEFNSLNDQYHSAVGGGHESAQYLVSFVDSYTPNYIDITNRKAGDVIRGFYITNAAYTYSSVLNGDGYSEKFEKGDFLKLIVIGKHADNTTSQVEYYLADYRSENTAEHYAVNTWEWLDLSSLGAVTELKFAIEGSQNNNYGLLTPSYFCMDDFNGEQAIAEASIDALKVGSQEVELLGYFDGFVAEAATDYSLVSEELENMEVKLNGGKLLVDVKNSGTSVVLIRAIQNGKNRLVRLTLNAVVDGIDEITSGEVMVYPVPATDCLTVESGWGNYSIELFTMDGRKILHYESKQAVVELPVGEYARGNYILKISSEKGCVQQHILLVE